MDGSHKRKFFRVCGAIGSLILIIIFSLPFLWMISMSFKTPLDCVKIPPVVLFKPVLTNYTDLFNRINFGNYMQNSIVVSLTATIVSMIISLPAAYVFARIRKKYKNKIILLVLSVRMAPAMSLVIPFFVLSNAVGILDTQLALIITYLSFNIPLIFWMMQGYFSQLPVEIEEAAYIDGCSSFGIFTRIALPLTVSGLSATAILCLIQSWNEFVYALFLTSIRSRTLPTTIMIFLGHEGIQWGQMTAATTLITLPVVFLAFLVKDYLVRGMAMGGIKE